MISNDLQNINIKPACLIVFHELMSNVGGHYLVLHEMEIKIYLSESNSLIYFHLVLDKKWKIYWSKQSFTGLCPQDWCSLWGLILILFVDHLCSNFIFIIWYFCNNMNLLNMGNNPVFVGILTILNSTHVIQCL
jgi:hypothetical protein